MTISLLTPLPVPVPPAFWWLTDASAGSARFAQAWTVSTGEGVTVSVVDRGIDHRLADLAMAYDATRDLDPRDTSATTPADQDASPDGPADTHGTQVAALIAGNAFNGIGTIGAAYGSTLTGSYLRYGSALNVAELVGLLAAQRQFDVSNNSWGVPQAMADSFLLSAWAPVAASLQTALTEGRGGLGTVFVFAGGNGRLMQNGQNVGDDSNFHNLSNGRHAIAVGASTIDGEVAFFSSPGANLLLAAPGMGLQTTDGGSGTATVHGSSFSAALVSATVALMLEANPALGWRDVQDILALTARPDPDQAAAANGARGANGGGLVHSRDLGFGLLDAEAAVRLAQVWTLQSDSHNQMRLAVGHPAVLTPHTGRQVMTFTVAPAETDLRIDTVSLRLTIADTDLRLLRIELVSPSGTRSVLAENLAAMGTRSYLDFTFSAAAFRGEVAGGQWTVELTHPTPSRSFVIYRAALDLSGDADGPDDAYVFTPSFADLAAADLTRRDISDPDGGTDSLIFAAARGPVTVDLSTGAARLDGTDLTLNGGFEVVIGTASADRLTGGTQAVTLRGGAGDDTLTGGWGNDLNDGGTGTDTVVMAGHWSDHIFTAMADGVRVAGQQSDDTLTGIERIEFTDGTIVPIGDNGLPLINESPLFARIAIGLFPASTLPDSATLRISAEQADLQPEASAAQDAPLAHLLATLTADDPNLPLGDTLQFALAADDIAAGFRLQVITLTTVALWGDPAALAAREGDLRISVTDLHGRTAQMTLPNPTATGTAGGITVTEAVAGATVTTLTGLPDGPIGLSDPRFEVTCASGGDVTLRLRPGVALDHEAERTISLQLTMDATTLPALTLDLVVTVRDINELPGGVGGLTRWSPAAIEAGQARTLLTNAPAMVDPEGAPLTYRLISLPALGGLSAGGLAIGVNDVLNSAEFATLSYRPTAHTGSFTSTFAVSDGIDHTALALTIVVTPASSDIITGDARDNALFGGGGNDQILGGAGRDRVSGGTGHDSLFGGAGDDRLKGGIGADLLSGGDGFDRAIYLDSNIGLTVSLADPARNTGIAAGDIFDSIEGLHGTRAADILTGNEGRNELRGDGGDDILDGGGGADILFGGAGADTFVFSSVPLRGAPDYITDFETGLDRIALSAAPFGVDPDRTGIRAPVWSGQTDLQYDMASGLLRYDPDGVGGEAGLIIARLDQGTALSFTDIVLLALQP